MGHLGLFLVIFEYFRVRGIWASLTGPLNRKSKTSTITLLPKEYCQARKGAQTQDLPVGCGSST